jgi:hypothetical protein
MYKLKLDQNSRFQISCSVNGIETFRDAVHPNSDADKWEPDYDPETEELAVDSDLNFSITTKKL